MSYKLPQEEQLKEMLEMFVGEDAHTNTIDDADVEEYSFFARYVNPDGGLAAACLADFPAAVALGSSLSMIGAGGIEDMLADKSLSDTANENFYEVMNMFSSLFMDNTTAHLKLTTVDKTEEGLGEIGISDCQRQDYSVSAGRYGDGKVSFLIC